MKTELYLANLLVVSALVMGSGCASDTGDDTAGGTGGTIPTGTGGASPAATGGKGAATGGTPAAGSGGQGVAGMTATGGTSGGGSGGGTAGAGGTGTGGTMGMDGGTMTMGMGECCADGDCLCHGDVPAAVTSEMGKFNVEMMDLPEAGCVFYPTDAEPPFAAVTISDGFGGSGGCGFSQTGEWGPLYASWGIVAMIIHTGAGDSPTVRGTKLSAAVEAYKAENMKTGSPLFGKLAGRYGTSGFSMGGGGTTYSAENDPTLRSNVSIMAWTPSTTGITVPSLYIFGSADGLAGQMGMASYSSIADSVPKMAVTVSSGHAGQPSSGGGASGEAGLAFQKVYLEGDERWKPLLLTIMADETNIH